MEFKAGAASLVLAVTASVGTFEDGNATFATETGDLTVTYGQPAAWQVAALGFRLPPDHGRICRRLGGRL